MIAYSIYGPPQVCPVWGRKGHVWIPFKGRFLFWRYYKECAACDLVVRDKKRRKEE